MDAGCAKAISFGTEPKPALLRYFWTWPDQFYWNRLDPLLKINI